MNKFIVAVIVVTLAIVGLGVFIIQKASNAPATLPTPGPKVDQSVLIRSDSEKISSPSATVTLVEFGDYQCPSCGAYHPFVKQLLVDLAGKFNFVFRNFPLAQHPNSKIAAYAAEAAGKQNKFWEMHNKIYETQNDWSDVSNSKATDIFVSYANSLGLNTTQFKKDIDSSDVKAKIDRDTQDGLTLGVDATPTFYLDGSKMTLPSSYEDFKTLVNAAIIGSSAAQSSPIANFHTHFDLKVYLNGSAVNFSLAKYQATAKNEIDPNIHMHDGNGQIVHIHKQGVTLDEFFSSLKMKFTNNCFTLDSGQSFCNNSSKSLKMFVNGSPNIEFENYQPQDIDRILITYGSETETQIKAQINAVSNLACIYSLKCPERGKPPSEDCVGGIGTPCTD